VGEKNSKMLHKNQYLLLPHIPSHDARSDLVDVSKNGSVNNLRNDSNENVTLQQTVNSNFLMENSDNYNNNNFAVINENDESYFEIFKTPLRFATNNNTEITAQIGSTAHLPCIIHNLGEGVVSKLHISAVLVLIH
jgi:hypothetical protein